MLCLFSYDCENKLRPVPTSRISIVREGRVKRIRDLTPCAYWMSFFLSGRKERKKTCPLTSVITVEGMKEEAVGTYLLSF